MRLVVQLLISIYMVLPLPAWAQEAPKDPLSYPLKQYGLMLGTAILGGLVSWYAKVRKGELAVYNVMHLIGELSTSAFAGLLAFWGCEAMGLTPLVTASLVGIAGHMGTRAITWAEQLAARKFGQPIASDSTGSNP